MSDGVLRDDNEEHEKSASPNPNRTNATPTWDANGRPVRKRTHVDHFTPEKKAKPNGEGGGTKKKGKNKGKEDGGTKKKGGGKEQGGTKKKGRGKQEGFCQDESTGTSPEAGKLRRCIANHRARFTIHI